MNKRPRARCVVDASAVLAVLFREPGFGDVLGVLPRTGMIAPPILRLEVANVARSKVRRGEVERADAKALLVDFEKWRVQSVDVTARDAWDVAWSYELTVYDAAYLHLALARRLPLVTLDVDLRATARGLARP